jgi:hypothetical protein
MQSCKEYMWKLCVFQHGLHLSSVVKNKYSKIIFVHFFSYLMIKCSFTVCKYLHEHTSIVAFFVVQQLHFSVFQHLKQAILIHCTDSGDERPHSSKHLPPILNIHTTMSLCISLSLFMPSTFVHIRQYNCTKA